MNAKQRAALEGASVRFYHVRRTTAQDARGNPVLASMGTIREKGLMVTPQGGYTRAVVEWPDGNTSSTIAWCSPRDNFNKAIGRAIAVGRAIKLREWALSGEAA